MVLYKRKPITLPDPEVLPPDLNIEVWHIDETGEWFSSYEKYLERFDFYSRHHFTCEITGTSCLTFFEALDSEEMQFRLVEERFPLKLREPVARFLHFNEVKRLDALVERVYVRFKNDFFPGEVVYLRKGTKDPSAPSSNHSTPQPDESFFKGTQKEAINETSQPQYQRPYIIKEKAQFNATTDSATGEVIVPAYSKYMLTEESHSNKSLIADQSQIYRDRSTFTKHLIKCFCKITLRRASSKMGAPWAVKDEYLPMYGLTMDWPPEMLKYKEDEDLTEKGRKQKPVGDFDDIGNEFGATEMEDTDDLDVEEAAGTSSKRRKVNEETKEGHIAPDGSAMNTITSILEDLSLPYQGPPAIFPNLYQYNQYLELIQLRENIKFKPFKPIGKLLQVFQFLSSFSRTLLLSHFTIDQFLTTLRCTDPQELKGETVYVQLAADGEKLNERKESDWQRSWPLRRSINNANTPEVQFTIVKNELAGEEMIDNVNSNGSALLIEIFCALLRMFVDENGDWSVFIPEYWLREDRERAEKPTSEHDESSDPDDVQDSEDSESDVSLEKCLEYRNMNWAERLSRRQFNNGYWLIILVGVLQECLHIPLYKESIGNFNQKIIPKEMSSTQLPKQLWRNFCLNLSIQEKLEVMWILVDLLTSYSSDIKAAVDGSLELCGLIRSERFRVGRDLKAEVLTLNQLQANLQAPRDAVDRDDAILLQMQDAVASQQSKVESLRNDKTLLDAKLMENDIQRLKPLGLDRYGNRYYWLDLSGVSIKKVSSGENLKTGDLYHSGRLWIQGPTKEAVKFYLKLPGDELDRWLNFVDKVGKKRATEEVFHIFLKEDGSYVHSENGMETELVNKDGLANYLIDLTPLQKKVIDETPGSLLLSDAEWYSVDCLEDVERLIEWFDTWGRREHDLLRQLKAVEEQMRAAYEARETETNCHQYDEVEQTLLFEASESSLLDSEIKSPTEVDGGVYQASDELDEKTALKDEEELDSIAEEIMKLDDCSQTRKIVDKVKELENRRDQLLARRKPLENQNGPGSRVQARAERKRLNNVRDLKLARQAKVLTDLLNHRHLKAMEDVVQWKNSLALRYYGTLLRKNASGNPKEPISDSVDQKLKDIINQTSRTTTAALAN